MTVVTSQVASIRSLLAAALQDGLDPVPVTDGLPRGVIEREHVAVLGDPRITQKWAWMGSDTKEEDFDLHLIIQVVTPGMTQEEANGRAEEILAAAETVIRTEENTGSLAPLVLWVEMGTRQLLNGPLDEGFGAHIDATVNVRTR